MLETPGMGLGQGERHQRPNPSRRERCGGGKGSRQQRAAPAAAAAAAHTCQLWEGRLHCCLWRRGWCGSLGGRWRWWGWRLPAARRWLHLCQQLLRLCCLGQAGHGRLRGFGLGLGSRWCQGRRRCCAGSRGRCRCAAGSWGGAKRRSSRGCARKEGAAAAGCGAKGKGRCRGSCRGTSCTAGRNSKAKGGRRGSGCCCRAAGGCAAGGGGAKAEAPECGRGGGAAGRCAKAKGGCRGWLGAKAKGRSGAGCCRAKQRNARGRPRGKGKERLGRRRRALVRGRRSRRGEALLGGGGGSSRRSAFGRARLLLLLLLLQAGRQAGRQGRQDSEISFSSTLPGARHGLPQAGKHSSNAPRQRLAGRVLPLTHHPLAFQSATPALPQSRSLAARWRLPLPQPPQPLPPPPPPPPNQTPHQEARPPPLAPRRWQGQAAQQRRAWQAPRRLPARAARGAAEVAPRCRGRPGRRVWPCDQRCSTAARHQMWQPAGHSRHRKHMCCVERPKRKQPHRRSHGWHPQQQQRPAAASSVPARLPLLRTVAAAAAHDRPPPTLQRCASRVEVERAHQQHGLGRQVWGGVVCGMQHWHLRAGKVHTQPHHKVVGILCRRWGRGVGWGKSGGPI